MSLRFAELAWGATPIGEVSLRRRHDPVTEVDLYEVKLGDDYLMSSLFTVAEVEVARLALERLVGPGEGGLDGTGLVVAVGGLGLGYTAEAVLTDARVRELVVVDLLEPIIDWHRHGLVPVGPVLTADPRCRLVAGDFFAMSAGLGFDPDEPWRLFDAVIVDIDHSPQHLLAGASADFYGVAGTHSLAEHLRPGGVYSLWSNDPPDDAYLAILAGAFVYVAAKVITFPNPLQGGSSTNTVYLATRAS